MWKISAALMVLAVCSLVLGIYRAINAAYSQPATQCFTLQEKDKLIKLAHDAIDEALKDQVRSLFDVWVRDPANQPKRAMSGMANNISAYHRASANIRQWEPVICQ